MVCTYQSYSVAYHQPSQNKEEEHQEEFSSSWKAHPLPELKDELLHHSLTNSRLWKQSGVFPEINKLNGYSMIESCQL